MTSAQARFGLLLAASAGWLCACASHAEPAHKPRHSTPAHPARTAPDVTATITKPAPLPVPPASVPTSRGGEIPPPFKLPSASRAKLRACGETWRDMKLAGTTGDDDWREFALKCLPGKGSTALAN